MSEPIDRSMSQLIEYTKSAHELLNREIFEGELSTPFIDFRNISKADSLYGAFVNDTSKNYETLLVKEPCAILLSHELLNEIDNSKSLEEQNAWIVSTLLHEMIHQFCHKNNIVDVEDGLHNESFANAAEEHGLMCFSRQTENGMNCDITYLDPDWDDLWSKLCADCDECL